VIASLENDTNERVEHIGNTAEQNLEIGQPGWPSSGSRRNGFPPPVRPRQGPDVIKNPNYILQKQPILRLDLKYNQRFVLRTKSDATTESLPLVTIVVYSFSCVEHSSIEKE